VQTVLIKVWVPVTVHREQIIKRGKQQDATIRCLLLTSVSTCFGHHYAHLQENKGPVTAFGVFFWFCWMWLVAVVGRCIVGCEQCSHPTFGTGGLQLELARL
jgi:glycerol-3-phosphate acyltransferase PlsY